MTKLLARSAFWASPERAGYAAAINGGRRFESGRGLQKALHSGLICQGGRLPDAPADRNKGGVAVQAFRQIGTITLNPAA